jgi:hypothetical protein
MLQLSKWCFGEGVCQKKNRRFFFIVRPVTFPRMSRRCCREHRCHLLMSCERKFIDSIVPYAALNMSPSENKKHQKRGRLSDSWTVDGCRAQLLLGGRMIRTDLPLDTRKTDSLLNITIHKVVYYNYLSCVGGLFRLWRGQVLQCHTLSRGQA